MHSVVYPIKSLAWISIWASSLWLADAGTRASPVSGCKEGSTTTSWHNSWSQLTVKSCNSLWQKNQANMMANHSMIHTKWSTTNTVTWTLDNFHSHLNHNTLWHSCLFKWKLSLMGRAVSQSDKHFALNMSICTEAMGLSWILYYQIKYLARSCCSVWWISHLIDWRDGNIKSLNWCIIKDVKRLLIHLDTEN